MFLEHPEVEPTNNAAERSLRRAAIRRKLSFGTQSEPRSRFVETLLAVIENLPPTEPRRADVHHRVDQRALEPNNSTVTV